MPGFHKELFDIVDLFAGAVERLAETDASADLVIDITESAADGVRACTAALSGHWQAKASREQAISQDALLNKRLHKRQLKLALFDALARASGVRPPWGALTGIRPTRLILDAMGEGLPLALAAAQVRDIFRISDEKTSLLTEIITVQQGLLQAGEKDIACYIGIPFCASRCRYCSFISREAGDGKLLGLYVSALIGEIEGTIALMRARGLKARSVYIGGGTPTVLDEAQLTRVLEAARPMFSQALEVTVEAGRPDTITPGKLRAIAHSGARRVSVNPQSAHDKTLELVGRAHTWAQTVEAFRIAREAGFTHINMDVIAGLPGEDLKMFRQTLNRVLDLRPEALTVHTLSIKRSSDMRRYGDSLAPGNEVERMVALVREQAREQGLEPYYIYRQKHMAGNLENVGYAKPGFACLYNLDMMEDQTTVLAMGAGAVSKLVYHGRKRILRAPNVKDIEHYIARAEEMLERKHALFEGVGKGVRAPMEEEESMDDVD